MSQTIFPRLSLDRSVIHWEDHIDALTPVEEHVGLYWKRDDYFAPLGYGGVNGAKVRQILWVITRYLETKPKNPGILLAGSVKSPQLGRVAAVAKHFGIPCLLVIGSKPETAYKHNSNVQIAATLGAEFATAKAPYNPALQAEAKRLHAQRPDYYLVEYGLSIDGTPERIESFYRFASEQARSIPDDTETLLLPLGSCNTAIAVLYGLARHKPTALRKVALFGIGPPRTEWFQQRLALLGISQSPTYQIEIHDLHTTGFATYQDEMPETVDGIALHPTYEGKMWRYLKTRREIMQGKTCFWIVGSAPSLAAMNLRTDALG